MKIYYIGLCNTFNETKSQESCFFQSRNFNEYQMNQITNNKFGQFFESNLILALDWGSLTVRLFNKTSDS